MSKEKLENILVYIDDVEYIVSLRWSYKYTK